ncbi:MAG: DUF2339 domain-containing protein, partial [Phycisphaerales bacterium]|nr:DUF2339 domain-containing protein [Phycisphaerales bacterium]
TLWLVDAHSEAPVNALVFISCVWIGTVVELVVSSRFFGSLRDRTEWSDESRVGFLVDESGEKTFAPWLLLTPEARWINALFGVSAWAVVAAAMTIRVLDADLDYLAPLGFGVASLLVAVFTVGKQSEQNAGLWAQHGSPRSALGAAMIINGLVLSVVTTATALGGWMQVVTWAMIGIAAIETGRRIRFRAAGIFGLILIGLAIVRLGTLDFAVHMLYSADEAVLGLGYSEWTWQMLFVGAVCGAAAWRSRYKAEAGIAGCVGLWVLALSLVHSESSPASIGTAFVLIAMTGAWIHVFYPVAALSVNAFVLASIGAGVALLGQINQSDSMPVMEINVVSMVLVGLGWVGFAARPRAGFVSRWTSAGLAIGAGAVALWSIDAAYGTPLALLFGSIYCAALIGIGHRLLRWSVMEIAGILVWTVTLGWAAYQINTGQSTFDQAPVIGVDFGTTIILVGSAVWIGRRLPGLLLADDASESTAGTRMTIAGVSFGLAWTLLLAGTSIEGERIARSMFAEGAVRGAGVSIWWSIFAVGSIVVGFRSVAMIRWAGLGLLGAVAIKVLVFDTVVLNPAARIVAMMTVGLVIMGAGALYAKLASISGAESEVEEGSIDEGG